MSQSFEVQATFSLQAESLDEAQAMVNNGDFGNIESAMLVDFKLDDVAVCDHCEKPMIPNISTGDDDGYGWICTTFDCGDFTGEEIDVDDLVAVGVPAWVADRIMALAEAVSESQAKLFWFAKSHRSAGCNFDS